MERLGFLRIKESIIDMERKFCFYHPPYLLLEVKMENKYQS